MKIVTVQGMREIERLTASAGIPEGTMMRLAGTGMARAVEAYIRESCHPATIRRIVVVAGKGNNGGDGLVIAGLLRRSFPVQVYTLAPTAEMREPARSMPEAADAECRPLPAGDEFQPGDLIVDAILGIGVSGAVRAEPAAWIRAVNAAGRPVVAVDVPSGLDADTGAGACVIQATLTLAAGAFKPGHFANPAVGRLGLVGIGAPAAALDAVPAAGEALTACEAAAFFNPLPADTFKNRTGRLLIAAGSAAYGGAALLATLGARSCGVGMLHTLLPRTALAGRCYPGDVILHPAAGEVLGADAVEELKQTAARVDAAVAGPGLGEVDEVFMQALFALEIPLVADADALNWLARHPEAVSGRRAPLLLTPHPGEAARLAPELRDLPRREQAEGLAGRFNATVILKGYQSVVAAPGRSAVNTSGAPTLATAGSGDVLAGLTGALLARRPDDPFAAAATACWLHGRAGELSDRGRATTADDLPERIIRAGREISWSF